MDLTLKGASEDKRVLIGEFLDLHDKTDMEHPAPEDEKALIKMLREHPNLWMIAGDLVQSNATQMIEKMVGAAVAPQKMIMTAWRVMRDDLGYQDATTAERLLIDQAATAWLRLQYVEAKVTGLMRQDSTFKLVQHWDRRLSAAQRRFLRAVETLARVRRIIRKTPAVQINIAEQQVNVAGDVTR